VLVAAGLGFRLYLILAGMPPTNSDESTMGLAASHIAEGRDYPAYFYGQEYMGTLEAYLAAPLFAAFGPSVVALRLPTLPMYAAFCCAMYHLTRRLYGPWFAVAVIGLLALGSNSVVRSETFAGGGYPEIKPIGAASLLLAVWLGAGRGQTSRWRLLGFAGWGLLAGLAWWTDPLIGPYLAAAGAVLVYACRRELFGWPGIVLVAAALAGAAPAIGHHLQPGAGIDSAPGVLDLSSGGDAPVWDRIYGAILLGVPLGTGLCVPGYCDGYSLAIGAAYPVALALAGALAVTALRTAANKAEAVRQAGRLALVVGGATILIGYAHSDGSGLSPATNVRYLSPLLISLPAVVWPLWTAATRRAGNGRAGNGSFANGSFANRRAATRRAATRRAATSGAGVARSVRRIAGVAPLAAVVASMVAPTVALAGSVAEGRAAARDEHALVAALERLELTRVYSDYWTCNRISFATGERVVCAVLDDNLRPGHDRYLPFRRLVAAAPRPAYVLLIGSPPQRAFAGLLAGRCVTADTTDLAGYRIYRPHAAIGVPSGEDHQ
jgi:hypothetical protein